MKNYSYFIVKSVGKDLLPVALKQDGSLNAFFKILLHLINWSTSLKFQIIINS